MNNLIINATRYTPEIFFDFEKNVLNVKGESYPENVAEFYEPVFTWVEQYLQQVVSQKITVNIDLVYFNSSSSKILLDFFDILEAAANKGKNIVVNWLYDSEDEDTMEFGKDFQEDFHSIQFNVVQKSD